MGEKKPENPAARKGWDKAEWEAKAKAKDEEMADRAKTAEEAMKQGKHLSRRIQLDADGCAGKKPKFKRNDDVPKPTKKLEARDDLNLEKGVNKTVLVQTTTNGKGPRGAGFYCEMCNRTLKDSLSYLDHVNSRSHLRMIGQTTQVARSTISQVRAKIADLRAQTANKVTAANFDFQKRLKDVKDDEDAEKQRRKEEKKRKREERKEEEALGKIGVMRRSKEEAGAEGKRDRKKEKAEEKEIEQAQAEHDDLAAMMGFGGFGGQKKR